MKQSILLIVFNLVSLIAISQGKFIAGDVMFGTFSMGSMKDLQNYLLEQSRSNRDLPYQIVSAFPAYFGFSYLAANPIDDKWSVGPRLQFFSTGGRFDYGDYSGHIRQDQLLRSYGLGAYIQRQLGRDEDKSFYFTSTLGVTVSHLILVSEVVAVGSQSEKERVGYFSLNYTLNPGLAFKRKISERFFLQGSAGFEISVHNKLRYSNNLKVVMQDYKDNEYNVAWDGLRLAIGTSYRILKNN